MRTRPFHSKTLSNGLRTVVVPEKGAMTVTVMVLVGTGSALERAGEHGLSHFLEHMCFKGTVRRPTVRDIVQEIEGLGAVTNAFTDRELTGYYIKGDPAHAAAFTDILADIYQHSTFPEAEVRKESGVIIEEINMYEDMPQHKVADLFFERFYPDTAIGRSILGTKESVSSLRQKDFLAYKKRFYTGANTVVVVAGNITSASALRLVTNYFGGVAKGSRPSPSAAAYPHKRPVVVVRHKATDQAHFMLGFPSLALGHKDLAALKILSTLLGRGMSSRLSMLIREELGAAYYVGSFEEHFIKGGVFGVATGVDKRRLPEILSRVIGECKRFKDELVSAKELAKAKEYALGTFRLGLELPDDLATFFGSQLVLRQPLQAPERIMARLRAVTAADVRRVARRVLKSDRAALAILGPFTDDPSYAKALSKL